EESESHHACCHAGRRPECAADAPDTNSLPQETERCRHLSPQAEAQTFSITTPIFIPSENQLHGVGTLVATAFTPEFTRVSPPSPSRPFYLRQSSLLLYLVLFRTPVDVSLFRCALRLMRQPQPRRGGSHAFSASTGDGGCEDDGRL